ncbi:MAG TPA: ABC transporter permease [Candidatus Micrarchaeaceae archaeon]|nr:ABC transporter permease [Candidatus Micrarchaeaceae archaeon]
MSYRRYLIGRLLLFPVAAVTVVSITFFLLNLVPTDVARALAGDFATPQQVQDVRHQLGLDKPLGQRYVLYMEGLIVRGDLGTSYLTNSPVRQQLLSRLPSSLELIVPGMLIATLLGVTMGTAGAYYSGRAPDRVSRIFVSVLQSMPEFLLALLLIYVVFFLLRLVPAPLGQLGPVASAPPTRTGFLIVDALIAGQWSVAGSALYHLVLPMLVIGLAFSTSLARVARTAVANALESPYIVFARACGLSERQVVRYALLDARTPLLTYLAILAGNIIGSAAIVELIFNWQGAGQWAISAALNYDMPSVLGFVAFGAVTTMAAYFILDIVAAALDPRITYRAAR